MIYDGSPLPRREDKKSEELINKIRMAEAKDMQEAREDQNKLNSKVKEALLRPELKNEIISNAISSISGNNNAKNSEDEHERLVDSLYETLLASGQDVTKHDIQEAIRRATFEALQKEENQKIEQKKAAIDKIEKKKNLVSKIIFGAIAIVVLTPVALIALRFLIILFSRLFRFLG